MTDTEQLRELAKQIADSGNGFRARGGMAVCDPESCQIFTRSRDGGGWHIELPVRNGGEKALKRAIAAGPDLSDDVTALGLLADMPHAWIVSMLDSGYKHESWRCFLGNLDDLGTESQARGMAALYTDGATRAAAIARAWLATYGDAK